MKLNTTTFWQFVVWLAAFIEWGLPQVPEKWKVPLTLLLGGLSIALHQHSGKRNPDSTDARLPWKPKDDLLR